MAEENWDYQMFCSISSVSSAHTSVLGYTPARLYYYDIDKNGEAQYGLRSLDIAPGLKVSVPPSGVLAIIQVSGEQIVGIGFPKEDIVARVVAETKMISANN